MVAAYRLWWQLIAGCEGGTQPSEHEPWPPGEGLPACQGPWVTATHCIRWPCGCLKLTSPMFTGGIESSHATPQC
jgi:hypothetical protein